MCAQNTRKWPKPLTEDAFYGIAGEYALLIEPQTEADVAAVLIQFDVAAGNIFGRGAYFVADGAQHRMNLFTVIVGDSSHARKGTSWGHVARFFSPLDPTWQIQTGLSSGEGLIHALRDWPGDSGNPYEKRMMIVESEFASPLKAGSRPGNTLSPTLRLAWDGSPLQVLTKLQPERATNTHVSLVAHITLGELNKELGDSDRGNGFANRQLWVTARRSKELPSGGSIPQEDLDSLQKRFGNAMEFVSGLGDFEYRRNSSAEEHWRQIYSHLSRVRDGAHDETTARAPAQVMRIACVYAAMDSAVAIRLEHLKAALAIWEYCEDSARYIFGAGQDLSRLDGRLLLVLTNAGCRGLSRTELSRAFSNNLTALEISASLDYLKQRGLVEMITNATDGRPEERWRIVEANSKE